MKDMNTQSFLEVFQNPRIYQIAALSYSLFNKPAYTEFCRNKQGGFTMSLLTSAVSMTKAMVQIDSTDPGTYEKAMADWIEQQLS